MSRRARAEWAELIKQWERSEATAEQFSERWGLNPRTLRYWKWRLDGDRRADESRSTELGATFTEVALATPTPAVEVTMGDVTVRVFAGAAPEQVEAIVAMLRGPR